MDDRLWKVAPWLLLLSGCMSFPGIKPEGRHRSTVLDASIWRRPPNLLSEYKKDPVLELAHRVTRVEDDLRRDGSITIKKPDVWGDANLMEYLQEHDEELRTRTKEFKETIQAYIANSDNAILSAESNLSGALSEKTQVTPITNQVINLPAIDPLALLEATQGAAKVGSLSLEPTQLARQHSVYVDVCQALRRRHLGDDNSRSAGYGLYKVRIPVSVLPGRETSEGYSAMVTLQAKPIVNSALLRYTFPRLAVADLVDTLTPNVREILTNETRRAQSVAATASGKPDPLQLADLGSTLGPEITSLVAEMNTLGNTPQGAFAPRTPGSDKVGRSPSSLAESIDAQTNMIVPQKAIEPAVIPMQVQSMMDLRNNTREAESPDLKNFINVINLAEIVDYVKRDMQLYHLVGTPKDDDIRPSLFKLFGEVHIVLEQQQIYSLQGDCIHDLGRKVLLGRYSDVSIERANWIAAMQQHTQFTADQLQASWLLALQTGILNQNLKRIAVRLGQEGKLPQADLALYDNCAVQFYNLDNGNEGQTVDLWRGIIEQEFPLYVFSLDPQFEEQTDVESLSRRRQLQLALAFSVAKQPFNSASRVAMSRQLALDEAAIGLNRTVVSFSHGSDTFGWYFRPRIQTPPVESTNIGALARTIWSTGPTEKYDLRHRKLEPGIRECEVLIVMPSFVREVNFDVTSNWECLSKPGVTKRSYEEMLAQGRAIHELKLCMPNLDSAACYRSGDIERLVQRIDQLDAMLGMQSYQVKLPYKFEQSGNGLFGQGRNNLKPRLTGFYGLQFAKTDDKEMTMSFFLRGANFHPNNTRVIVGGRIATVNIISRELVQVSVTLLSADLVNLDNGFEVHLATPDGLSNPQYIPLAGGATKETPTGFSFAKPALVLAKYSGACCSKPTFEFMQNNLAITLLHSPQAADWMKDTSRYIIFEASATKLDGTPITFGSNARSRVRSKTFELEFLADQGVWKVERPEEVWANLASQISVNHPNIGQEDFKVILTAYIAHEATQEQKTLNQIVIPVSGCECLEPAPQNAVPATASGSQAVAPPKAAEATPDPSPSPPQNPPEAVVPAPAASSTPTTPNSQ